MGAFEEIKEMIEGVQSRAPERRTDCPECDYPLEETPQGLHCRFCGWTEDIAAFKRRTNL